MVVGCYGSGFLWFRCDVDGGIDYVVGIVMVIVLVTIVVAVVVVPLMAQDMAQCIGCNPGGSGCGGCFLVG